MKFFKNYLESKFFKDKKSETDQAPELSDEASFEVVSESPKRAKELIDEFEQKEHLPMGEIISFEGVSQKDVYNIIAPFEIDGQTYIAGRVESRDTELNSQTCFFEKKNEIWSLAPETPIFNLQDPFVTKIGPELILGGVEVFLNPNSPDLGNHSGDLSYRTLFFRGKTLPTLTHFATGPEMMKNIRILSLPDDKILVCTRPQSPWVPKAGQGKIGITIISQIEELTATNVLKAEIIKGQFCDKEWGGVDELHFLEDGKIGVLGHIAYEEFSSNNKRIKHYYATAFTLELETGAVSSMRIIASRQNFPSGPAKRSPELKDVIFPGGLIRHQNGTATLYAGLSDAQAGRLTLPDPWLLPKI